MLLELFLDDDFFEPPELLLAEEEAFSLEAFVLLLPPPPLEFEQETIRATPIRAMMEERMDFFIGW